MYELWNLLSETGLSRETKQRICWGMLKAMEQRARIHDGVEAVDRVIVEDACAIPAKEPEKPKRDYIRTIEQSACAKCGESFHAGDLLELREDRFLQHPACPPKPEVGGLGEILDGHRSGVSHNTTKRRIVEAVKALILKHPDVDEFIQAVEKWGGK